MFFALTVLALFQVAAPPPSVESQARYRPHCTLAGEDLPYWLALLDPNFRDREKLRLPDGLETNRWRLREELESRHSAGHGLLPLGKFSVTWREAGSVACDPVGLRALAETLERSASETWWLSIVASWFELNGDLDEAERLLHVAIERDNPNDFQSARLAEFLTRRGRFAEALAWFARSRVSGACGLDLQSNVQWRLEWTEHCSRALNEPSCDEPTRTRKFDKFVRERRAHNVVESFVIEDSPRPVADALAWFDDTLAPYIVAHRIARERERFVNELAAWERARRIEPHSK